MKLRRISVLLSIKDRFLSSHQQAIRPKQFQKMFHFPNFQLWQDKGKGTQQGIRYGDCQALRHYHCFWTVENKYHQV